MKLFPSVGSDEGDAEQCGEKFRWRMEIRPTPNPLFRRVNVSVFVAVHINKQDIYCRSRIFCFAVHAGFFQAR